jgi:uncharacterized protein with HEPN domain
MKDKDSQRILHILDSIQEIEGFTEKVSLNEFLNNRLLQLSITRLLEIIGEASAKLSDEYKSSYPNIEWKSIIGFRNIIVHEYFGLDYHIIWDIIKNHITQLKQLKPHQ